MRHLSTMIPRRRAGLAGVVWLLSCATAAAGEHRLTLRPAGGVPAETPLSLPAPDDLEPGAYLLRASNTSQPIQAVVAEGPGGKSISFVAPELSGTASFEVEKSDQADKPGAGVAFSPEGPNLRIAIDGEPLTVHRVDRPYKPILHPLLSPSGAPLTRAYPIEKVEGEDIDHPHHESFWFTHGKVNGVDFWSVDHGTIRETSREIEAAGPVLGRLVTRDDWLDPEGKKVCEDERTLTVHATKSVRILDYDVTIKATAGPVVFGETKEGTFGVRVASSMDADGKSGAGGAIRNAEGLKDADAWGKSSAWVDYSGPVRGGTEGIAILNHPESFRYPTTWHVRTYGLFAANPFGGHDFGVDGYGEHTLAAGESLRFAYRVILHKGGADDADLARRFALYAEAPEADWDAAD